MEHEINCQATTPHEAGQAHNRQPTMNYLAHPTTIIDDNCEIGEGTTKIWHFSHIMSHCKIGANCNKPATDNRQLTTNN